MRRQSHSAQATRLRHWHDSLPRPMLRMSLRFSAVSTSSSTTRILWSGMVSNLNSHIGIVYAIDHSPMARMRHIPARQLKRAQPECRECHQAIACRSGKRNIAGARCLLEFRERGVYLHVTSGSMTRRAQPGNLLPPTANCGQQSFRQKKWLEKLSDCPSTALGKARKRPIAIETVSGNSNNDDSRSFRVLQNHRQFESSLNRNAGSLCTIISETEFLKRRQQSSCRSTGFLQLDKINQQPPKPNGWGSNEGRRFHRVSGYGRGQILDRNG